MSDLNQISETVAKRIRQDLQKSYMEIIPVPGIEDKLDSLPSDMYLAVTCSPTKGVDETLELSEKLIERGFKVTPHIASKCVSGEKHLEAIIKKLDELGIESIFVPGGDRPEPMGDFNNALDLLKALKKLGHNLNKIGMAAHPEGHPDVSDEILMEALEEKKDLADFIVTQMCFDAEILNDWMNQIHKKGIELPVWVGLPGVIERGRLLKTSLRIGVGDSLRFLRKKSQVATELMKSSIYNPDDLVRDITEQIDINDSKLAGYHIYCFNQIETTEKWRTERISALN
ncbi:MAG: methylenetetrahydrofolate reductase [Gammaproteobacteria bacterium]|nr:methylenetetrahydrofolate reductase [Gammaproteobacteria bacterium]